MFQEENFALQPWRLC